MKFANIDDAIMEAAKKPAAKPAPKTAAKKVEPKKAPAKPAPKPAAKRTPAKPAAKSAAKKTGNKKRVVTPPPAPETDDKGTENKGAEEKPTQEKPAETKPTQSADSNEPRKFAPRWLQSKPRGIGDRLKTAWKGFTAKAGDKIDVPHKYKSVFHEIQKLMEQLQLVEAMLQEQSLNESYDAGTVNNLYAHRDAIRSVLVEQIVREELYQHNVTIAELGQRQRAALMKTVNVRANALWEGLNQMEEGKLSRLAAGLGLAGAAMMGSPDDAGAQQARPTQAPTTQVPNDSVQTASSRDMQLAFNKAGHELNRRRISQQGARRDIVQNPDGTYTATIDARKQPTQAGAPQMEDAYTIEEWMGMMEEAGYSLEEGFMDNLRHAGRQVRDTAKGAGRLAGATLAAARGGDVGSAVRGIGSDMKTAYKTGAAVGRGADTKYEPGRQDIAHTGQKGSVGAGIKNVFRNVRAWGQGDKPDYAAITKGARSGQLKIDADKEIEKNKDPLAYRSYEPSESYTLEEWMGALEESGYNLNELSPELLQRAAWRRGNQANLARGSGAQISNATARVHKDLDGQANKLQKHAATKPSMEESDLNELSPELLKRYAKASKADMQKNLAKSTEKTLHVPGIARAEKRFQGQTAAFKRLGGDPDLAESLNENTVARLQSLAGIKPTE